MMAKISCDLIQDLLPLYCDDVCSADSKNIVETHLQECEACAKLFQQLKSKCIINTKAREEKSAEEFIIGKIAHSWKRSILKAFFKGAIIAAIILSLVAGGYYTLFVQQNSMVAFEDVLVSAYMLTDEHITFHLQVDDGYCGGTMKTYIDEERNLYISIQRTLVKEKLTNGEEVMDYGFNLTDKNCVAVYYGVPGNCKLLWKQGDVLPKAEPDIFE